MRSNLIREVFSFSLALFSCLTVIATQAEAAGNNPYCISRFGGLFCPDQGYGGAASPLSPFSVLHSGDVFALGTYTSTNFTAKVAMLYDSSASSESWWFVGTTSSNLPIIAYNTPCAVGDVARGTFGLFDFTVLTPIAGGGAYELIKCHALSPLLGGIRPDDYYAQPNNTTTPVTPATFMFDKLF